MATEVLKIQLDTLQLECQASQVENARLSGENPLAAEAIEKEREKLKQEVDNLSELTCKLEGKSWP